VEENWRTFSQE